MTSKIFDMTIIGGGPVGLFAAGLAGEMGASCILLESRFRLGGIMMAAYPDKDVYNFPGIQSIRGSDLIVELIEKAGKYGMASRLGEYVDGLMPANKKMVMIKTNKRDYLSSVAIIASGLKAHHSPLSDYIQITDWDGAGIYEHLPSLDDIAGKSVAIVLGSSVDLDIPPEFQDTVSSLVIISDSRHSPGGVDMALPDIGKANAEIVRSPWIIKNIRGSNSPETLIIINTETGQERSIPVDVIIGLYDTQARQTLYSNLGIEMVGQQIKVDQRMQTSLRRVYAIGDIAWYPGKVMMLSSGIYEARVAVKNALKII